MKGFKAEKKLFSLHFKTSFGSSMGMDLRGTGQQVGSFLGGVIITPSRFLDSGSGDREKRAN